MQRHSVQSIEILKPSQLTFGICGGIIYSVRQHTCSKSIVMKLHLPHLHNTHKIRSYRSLSLLICSWILFQSTSICRTVINSYRIESHLQVITPHEVLCVYHVSHSGLLMKVNCHYVIFHLAYPTSLLISHYTYRYIAILLLQNISSELKAHST